jgi:hypothetical protein
LTWDDTGKVLEIGGDINLDDGGTYATTLQVVTPTANRTISFPDAPGTVALVAGSSGQLLYNNAGANAGTSTITYDGTNVTLSGRFISSLNGAASAPPGTFTGTWFTGGTATTTKPQVVIEPTGTTSTAWSTSGTGLGVNAASGFAGNLLDLQINGTSHASVSATSDETYRGLTVRGNAAGTNNIRIGNLFGSPAINATSTSGLRFTVGTNDSVFAYTSSQISFNLPIGPNTADGIRITTSDPGGHTRLLQLGVSANLSSSANITVGAVNCGLTPASGTGTLVAWDIAPTINQTGTATGDYVALRIRPTITAATGTNKLLIQAGTASSNNRLVLTESGRLGLGVLAPSSMLHLADAGDITFGTTTGTKIGTAAAQKLGFFGADPVVQQTELTDELTTITHTAPGTADFAIQNLVAATGYGFVTEDEGNTVLSVIANLQARVNELETKLVALGFLADAD